MNVSGAPKFSIELDAGKVITLGELVDGAEITVAATGVFTAESENAEAYAGYFKPANEKLIIVAENNVLAIIAEVGSTVEAYCEHCDQTVLWTEFGGVAASGHYYLSEAYNATEKVTVAADVADMVLDLKGQTWTTTGSHALNVSGTLSVIDSGEGGVIKATGPNSAGGVMYINGGTFNLYSGTLDRIVDEAYTVTDGGVVYARAGNINIYGGTIQNGTADRGGNVYMTGASTFYMEDGSVLNGTASNTGNAGGNVRGTSDTTIIISGGTISGGNATAGTSGNIYAGGTLTISGGEITGGTAAKQGDDIYAVSTVNVSGAPKFSIELDAGKVITLGELVDGAEITVAATGVFTEAAENINSYAAFFKAADENKQIVVEGDTLAVAGTTVEPDPTDPEATDPSVPETTEPTVPGTTEPGTQPSEPENGKVYCPHCETEVEFTAWDGTAASGHYYLTEAVTMDAKVTIGTKDDASMDMVLDLRGQTWTTTGTHAFYVYGTLSVMDSAEGGVIKATGPNEAAGGVVYVNKGTFNLYSGTLDRIVDEAYAVSDGGVVYVTAANVNVYGGTIQNGTADRGGNVYMTGASTFYMEDGSVLNGSASDDGNAGGNVRGTSTTTINISGGTISGGNAAAGTSGNIYAGGALTISGGEITGGTAAKQGDDIYAVSTVNVSGAPKFSIELDAGKVMTLGELADGAQITVTAPGVFAQSENASTYAAYFKAAEEGKTIVAEGNTLVVADATTEEPTVPETTAPAETEPSVPETTEPTEPAVDPTTVDCPHCDDEIVWTVWDGTVASGHYYLAEDYTTADQLSIEAGVDMVLNLNGQTWTTTGSRAFKLYGTLSILDSAEDGVLAAAGETGGHGGVIYAYGDSVLNLYSGTVTQTQTHNKANRGGVFYIYQGTFNMTGGAIINGQCTGYGGNIAASGAIINISGGEISGGHAEGINSSNNKLANGGGNICAYSTSTVTISGDVVIKDGTTGNQGGNIYLGSGTWNITGGTITGGSATNEGQNTYVGGASTHVNISGGEIGGMDLINAGSFTVSGAPKLAIELVDGQVMTLGELTENAQITVAATGAINAANDNAAAYLTAGYILPAEGYSLSEENGVISAAAQ